MSHAVSGADTRKAADGPRTRGQNDAAPAPAGRGAVALRRAAAPHSHWLLEGDSARVLADGPQAVSRRARNGSAARARAAAPAGSTGAPSRACAPRR